MSYDFPKPGATEPSGTLDESLRTYPDAHPDARHHLLSMNVAMGSNSGST